MLCRVVLGCVESCSARCYLERKLGSLDVVSSFLLMIVMMMMMTMMMRMMMMMMTMMVLLLLLLLLLQLLQLLRLGCVWQIYLLCVAGM